jgi:hypothetical protein
MYIKTKSILNHIYHLNYKSCQTVIKPGNWKSRESITAGIYLVNDFESSFLALCQTRLCYKAIDPIYCCHYKFCNGMQ